jgi:hypothetical protein
METALSAYYYEMFFVEPIKTGPGRFLHIQRIDASPQKLWFVVVGRDGGWCTGAPEIPININQKVELGFEHNRPHELNVDLTWSM